MKTKVTPAFHATFVFSVDEYSHLVAKYQLRISSFPSPFEALGDMKTLIERINTDILRPEIRRYPTCVLCMSVDDVHNAVFPSGTVMRLCADCREANRV